MYLLLDWMRCENDGMMEDILVTRKDIGELADSTKVAIRLLKCCDIRIIMNLWYRLSTPNFNGQTGSREPPKSPRLGV